MPIHYKKSHLANNGDTSFTPNTIPAATPFPDPSLNVNTQEFNNYGYRSDTFIHDHSALLTIGCSHTYGLHLPLQYRYSTILSNHFNLKDYNLSTLAASNDYISRVLQQSINVLKPKLVIICFTDISRKEYFDHNGESFNFTMFGKPPRWQCKTPRKKTIFKSIKSLTNNYNDLYNFTKNFKIVSTALEDYNWYFATTIHEPRTINKKHPRYLGFFKRIDLAYDHPGVISNQKFVEQCLFKIKL